MEIPSLRDWVAYLHVYNIHVPLCLFVCVVALFTSGCLWSYLFIYLYTYLFIELIQLLYSFILSTILLFVKIVTSFLYLCMELFITMIHYACFIYSPSTLQASTVKGLEGLGSSPNYVRPKGGWTKDNRLSFIWARRHDEILNVSWWDLDTLNAHGLKA